MPVRKGNLPDTKAPKCLNNEQQIDITFQRKSSSTKIFTGYGVTTLKYYFFNFVKKCQTGYSYK